MMLIHFAWFIGSILSDRIVFPDDIKLISDSRSDPRLPPPVNPSIKILRSHLQSPFSISQKPLSRSRSAEICSRPFGFFPHERRCDQFYQCSWGKAYLKTCPPKTVWNSVQLYCDWPNPNNPSCDTGSTSKPPTASTTTRTTTTTSLRPSPGPVTPTPGTPSCGGSICGKPSVEPITAEIKSLREKSSCTLENSLVEKIAPGSSSNPKNVKNVEAVFPESKFNEFFPNRNQAYTYANFLKAIGKYPSICKRRRLCPKILTAMFAHFEQETAGLFYLEEINKGAYCADWSEWVKAAYPCVPGKKYFGRGAKQLSWNYNYGAFSNAMFGDPMVLLRKPELVADTWLNFASSMWFFVTPQPPKPSMLQVLDGSWRPNSEDLASGLTPGFGTTIMIINGEIECGRPTTQAQNRVKYYKEYAIKMGVNVGTEELSCSNMRPFSSGGSMGQKALYWAPENNCQLVVWQTAFSALVEGDYSRCKGVPNKCKPGRHMP